MPLAGICLAFGVDNQRRQVYVIPLGYDLLCHAMQSGLGPVIAREFPLSVGKVPSAL